MIADSDAPTDDSSPDQFIAEFEARIREIEAAGGQAQDKLKHQLERMKRMLAEGRGEGIRFMRAGDTSSGLMGFSVPLVPDDVPRDPEEGATNPRMQPTNAGGALLRPRQPSARGLRNVSFLRSFAADAHFVRLHAGYAVN